MIRLSPYITFNGNCREAMTFYQQCLGGELELRPIGESRMAGQFPKEMHDKILHSMLTSKNIVLMATDVISPDGLKPGNDTSLTLYGEGEEELFKEYFDRLSVGGTIHEKIDKAPWGDLFGALRDKYGKEWMFNSAP